MGADVHNNGAASRRELTTTMSMGLWATGPMSITINVAELPEPKKTEGLKRVRSRSFYVTFLTFNSVVSSVLEYKTNFLGTGKRNSTLDPAWQ
jgi:hypothetical protein